MRQAILHLAFEGLDAAEATSDAFLDNAGSNAISRALRYRENSVDWATRRGEPGLLQRWRLTREDWLTHRRSDIQLHGVADCKAALALNRGDRAGARSGTRLHTSAGHRAITERGYLASTSTRLAR
jgi:hypothetical protein